MTDLALTIERYAEMRAEMDAGKLRDEVLAISGLSVDAWTVQQSAWLEKMGAELEGGRFELTNRYSRAFLDRQTEIQKRAAPPPVVKSTAPIAPIVEPAPIVAPVAPITPVAPVAPIAPTEPGFASVPMGRGQLFVSDAPSPWAATPEPRAAAPKQDLASTSFFSAESFVAPALPFQPGSGTSDSVPPPAPAAQAAPPPRKKVDRSTQAISVVSLEDILPFDQANPAHPPVPTQPLPQAHAQPPVPTQPLPQAQVQPPAPVAIPAPPPPRKQADSVLPPLDKDPLASTMGFDNAINLGPALPFGSAGAAKSPPEAPRPAAIPPNIPAAPQQAKSDSSFPPRPPPQPVHQIPVPGKRASESSFPRVATPPSPVNQPPPLTLEQYASLCVELNAAPHQAAEIAGRYGLTQPQWTTVNAYWQGRMTHEPDVRAAWERACVTYRQWLLGR